VEQIQEKEMVTVAIEEKPNRIIRLTENAFSKLMGMKNFYGTPSSNEEDPGENLTFSEFIELLHDEWCDEHGEPDIEIG